jgi:hypothetical protein
MSFDITAFWSVIQSIGYIIEAFMAGIPSSLTAITNTGQGVFSGLLSVATGIWDAVVKFGKFIYDGITEALNTLGSWLSQGLYSVGNWLWSTLGNIGSAVYSAFQWIYNGIIWVGGQIWNGLVAVYNWLIGTFSTLWGYITTGWNNLATTVNTWMGTLVTSWRTKAIAMVKADIAIHVGWTGINKLPEIMSGAMGDVPIMTTLKKALMSSIGSPIMGIISGEMFGAILDTMIPSTTVNVQLIPTLTLGTPSISALSVTYLAYPTAPTPPTGGSNVPYSGGASTTDATVSSDSSGDTSLDSSDKYVEPTLTYETVVA